MKVNEPPYEVLDIDGYTLKIYVDKNPENPRRRYYNLGEMVCWHHRYTLGDVQVEGPESALEYIANEVDPTVEDRIDYWAEVIDLYSDYERFEEKKERIIDKALEKAIILDIYMYEHGGVSLSTTPFPDKWDSGQIGYIYTSLEKVRKKYGVSRVSRKLWKTVEEELRMEVEAYGHFLNGEVYGYLLYSPDGEIIDGLWGFYGDDWEKNGMMDRVNEVINLHSGQT